MDPQPLPPRTRGLWYKALPVALIAKLIEAHEGKLYWYLCLLSSIALKNCLCIYLGLNHPGSTSENLVTALHFFSNHPDVDVLSDQHSRYKKALWI